MKYRVWALIILACLATSGCVRIDIGDDLPSIGEQLIDLEQARHLDAISDEEFKRLRRAILARL